MFIINTARYLTFLSDVTGNFENIFSYSSKIQVANICTRLQEISFFLSENVLKTCSKNCHPFVEKKKCHLLLRWVLFTKSRIKKRANSGWKSLSMRYNLGGKTWVQRYTSRESVTLAFISCLSPQQSSRSGYWNTLYVTLCWSYRCHKVDLVLSIIRVCARKWRGSKKIGKDFLFVTGLIIFRRAFQEKIIRALK